MLTIINTLIFNRLLWNFIHFKINTQHNIKKYHLPRIVPMLRATNKLCWHVPNQSPDMKSEETPIHNIKFLPNVDCPITTTPPRSTTWMSRGTTRRMMESRDFGNLLWKWIRRMHGCQADGRGRGRWPLGHSWLRRTVASIIKLHQGQIAASARTRGPPMRTHDYIRADVEFYFILFYYYFFPPSVQTHGCVLVDAGPVRVDVKKKKEKIFINYLFIYFPSTRIRECVLMEAGLVRADALMHLRFCWGLEMRIGGWCRVRIWPNFQSPYLRI
jgi:hypothetical protein